jgi:hypothetical protein
MADQDSSESPLPALSLLRSIRDGSAGMASRLLVSLGIGLFVSALACVGCFVMGALFPPAGASASPVTRVHVDDYVAISCFLTAGVAYLLPLLWIWSRWTSSYRKLSRSRPILRTAAWTLGVWLSALLLCLIIGAIFSGDDEFLVAAVLLAAGGVTLSLWMHLDFRHFQGRALRDQAGAIDLRCPECHYLMVGLREARCPECGREYTLDELVGRQDFDVLRLRHLGAGPRNGPEPSHVSPSCK